MQTPEGKAYRKGFEQELAVFERPCLKETEGDSRKFELFVQIGKNGDAENAETHGDTTPFAYCLERAIYVSYSNKETPFTPPPHPPYWVILELDPTSAAASAK